MPDEELVRAYEELVLQQEDSFLNARIALFNKQFRRRGEIADELRSRPGDRRELLAGLFTSRSPWVRICVARDTFALNEARSRMHMQYVADHASGQYRGEARSALGNWDAGRVPH